MKSVTKEVLIARNKAVEGIAASILARSDAFRRATAEQQRLSDVRESQNRNARNLYDRWHRDAIGTMAEELGQSARLQAERIRTDARGRAEALVPTQRAISKKHRVRAARRAIVDDLSARRPGETLRRLEAKRARLRAEALEATTDPVLQAYRRCGYRQAEGRWVGGENDISVGFGAPGVRATTSTVWHKKHTWKGTNLDVTLWVPEDWLEAVHGRGVAVVEGRLTLSARPIPAGEHEELLECSWVEQARGLDLRTEHGVLYRRRSRGAGSAWLPWVHAANLRGAQAVYARMLRKASEAAA